MLGLLILAFSFVADEQAASPSPPTVQNADQDDEDDLVVTGHRQRGALDTPVKPEVQIPSRAIRAFGVTSVAEVLEQLEPQTRGAKPNGSPAVLVDGKRISSMAEVRELPPEAISRIDVYPAAAAGSFGFGAGQRLINVVLKRRYRALTLTARPTLPIGDGRKSYEGRVDLVRLAAGARTTATIDLRRAEPVYERDTYGVADKTRTARALVDHATFNAAMVRQSGSATLRIETDVSTRGLGVTGLEKRQARAEASGGRSGTLGHGQWTLNAAAMLDRTQSRISDGITPRGNGLSVPVGALWGGCRNPCAIAAVRQASIEGFLRAPLPWLGTKATGSLLTVLEVSDISSQEFYDRSLVHRRSTLKSQGSVQVPFPGDLEPVGMDAQFGIAHTSDFGELVTWGAGMSWRANENINFDVRYNRERIAPTLEQLGAPAIPLPSVRLYDFVQGSSTLATIISGGSHDLRPQIDRTWTWRAQWIAMGLSVEYSNRRISGSIVTISAPTSALQHLLPVRMSRAADGKLIAFDTRPFNAHVASRSELTTGINRAARWRGNDLRFAVYHRWRLRDEVTLIDGERTFNLLDGDAIEADGGTSRHFIEANGSVSRAGITLYAAAKWMSGGSFGSGSKVETRYDRGVRLDLKLLVNLSHQGWLRRLIPETAGTLNLSVDNVFNSRPSLRSAGRNSTHNGQIFAGSGRTIRVTLRKRFQ